MVTGVAASHLLAMKARACRDEDLEDIALLLRHLDIRIMDEIRQAHAAVFPRDSLSPRKERRLEAVLRQVLAAGTADQGAPFRSIRPPRRPLAEPDG